MNWQEEEDKQFLVGFETMSCVDAQHGQALQKNVFRSTILADSFKSFSQFPPSVYRRNYACVRIQKGIELHAELIISSYLPS